MGDLFNNLRLARQREVNENTMVRSNSGHLVGPLDRSRNEQELNEILAGEVWVGEAGALGSSTQGVWLFDPHPVY